MSLTGELGMMPDPLVSVQTRKKILGSICETSLGYYVPTIQCTKITNYYPLDRNSCSTVSLFSEKTQGKKKNPKIKH